MEEVTLSQAVKKLNLPVRLGIPFSEEITKRNKWDWEIYLIFFNCLADILDKLGISNEQLVAIGDQYFKEEQEKEKK